MDASPAIEALIQQRAEVLERGFDRIVSCRAVIECQHPRQGPALFQVRVELNVPGREIVVGREAGARHQHTDIHVAIREAFDSARRLLEEHAREARGDVKSHAVPDHGEIAGLLPDGGFIREPDGNEVYFHRNSVANGGFDRLSVGDAVRFVAQEGESEKGPQASTVVPLGKHHLPPVATVRK